MPGVRQLLASEAKTLVLSHLFMHQKTARQID